MRSSVTAKSSGMPFFYPRASRCFPELTLIVGVAHERFIREIRAEAADEPIRLEPRR